MSIWQDAKGNLHDDMNGEALSLPSWPSGMMQLSATAAAAAQGAVAAGYVWNGSAFIAPPSPPLAQQAASAIGAGLTIALSGTMTLAGTLFPTDAETTAKLSEVVTTVNATATSTAPGTFPGGGSTFPMKDSAGNWHTFTVSQYKAVAGAIAGYVASLRLIADGNPLGATALPSASVALVV